MTSFASHAEKTELLQTVIGSDHSLVIPHSAPDRGAFAIARSHLRAHVIGMV